MRMPKMISSLSLSAALLFSAEAQEPTLPRMELATDKACYLPGEMVHLTASGTPPSALFIRYRHGAQILAEVPYAEVVKAGRWSWRPPRRNFQGYLVEVYTRSAECELVVATIAVDVSSDWRRFPRYGFVADFDDGGDPAAKRTRIAEEMAFLNRCHINGVQFQDWQWKHHYPAPLDAKGQLMPAYRDVSNRSSWRVRSVSSVSGQPRLTCVAEPPSSCHSPSVAGWYRLRSLRSTTGRCSSWSWHLLVSSPSFIS